MSWPVGRHPTGPAVDQVVDYAEGRAAPGTYPVPAGRGRWRLILLARQFTNTTWGTSAIAELTNARSRHLELKWNDVGVLTFTVPGHSDAAKTVIELMTDVLVLRWDDQTNQDVPVFRGIVTQSQDELSEQEHTVNFTCQDYTAMLSRRVLRSTLTVTQMDQDDLAITLVQAAWVTGFMPGAWLPLSVTRVNPDGSNRSPKSGQLRDRTYLPGVDLGSSFNDLARVINGFDYDINPFFGGGTTADSLRIYYPYQGVTRSVPLIYGSSIATVSRTVSSADYSNYWRVIGNNGVSDPAAPQFFSEAWNADANDITRIPIGLWMGTDNAADVSIQATLDDKAQGDLALNGVLVPTYALGLRPNAYSWGNPKMGDVVPLIIQAGRLNVNTTVRVLGLTYDIGDDGQEDVTLTVGRPAVTLPQLIGPSKQDVAALTRR